MALPSGRVTRVLLREATKVDLDPSATADSSRPTFHRCATHGPVPVDALGLRNSVAFNSSKRFELHGGRCAEDRAVLLQSSGNVEELMKAGLKLEQSLSEADLQPGSFGENLFVTGFGAATLCVGDVVESWRGEGPTTLRLQISSPRCPCGKVDEKLGRTFTASGVRAHCARTGLAGCFLRTLHEGDIQEGDVLKVVERPHPQWTLSRISYLMYGNEVAVMQYLLRGRKAVKDRETSVIRREEFMGSPEELEELAALSPLAVFEWKEHAVKMLGTAAPIGRYSASPSLVKRRSCMVLVVGLAMAAVALSFLAQRKMQSRTR